MKIDGNISYLFFNTELSVAELPTDRDGVFQGYDETKLHDEAEIFLGCLGRLGVATPSVDDLIADFYSRI
jgi:hypothetical protein